MHIIIIPQIQVFFNIMLTFFCCFFTIITKTFFLFIYKINRNSIQNFYLFSLNLLLKAKKEMNFFISFFFIIYFIDIYNILNFFYQILSLENESPCKYLFYYLILLLLYLQQQTILHLACLLKQEYK